jgi:hypothetical protein
MGGPTCIHRYSADEYPLFWQDKKAVVSPINIVVLSSQHATYSTPRANVPRGVSVRHRSSPRMAQSFSGLTRVRVYGDKRGVRRSDSSCTIGKDTGSGEPHGCTGGRSQQES